MSISTPTSKETLSKAFDAFYTSLTSKGSDKAQEESTSSTLLSLLSNCEGDPSIHQDLSVKEELEREFRILSSLAIEDPAKIELIMKACQKIHEVWARCQPVAARAKKPVTLEDLHAILESCYRGSAAKMISSYEGLTKSVYSPTQRLEIEKTKAVALQHLKEEFVKAATLLNSLTSSSAQSRATAKKETSSTGENLASKHYADIKCTESDIVEISKTHLGIENEGGNDCFLISCLQFLKTGFLKKHVLDQLPERLYNLVSSKSPSSSKIRNYLVKHPKFARKLTERGLNIAHGQLDAQETFASILDISLDPKLESPEQFERKVKVLFKDLENQDEEFYPVKILRSKIRRSKFPPAKLFYHTLLIPCKFYFFISEGLSKLFCGADTPSQEELYVDTEDNSKPLIPQPPRTPSLKTPLDMALHTKRSWDVSSVPEGFKQHENFGGETNSSKKIDAAQFLDIALDESKSRSVDNLVSMFFSKQKIEDKSLVRSPDGKKVEAPFDEQYQLEKAPQGLCISFKRTLFDPIRKSLQPLENPQTFTLEKECFVDGDSSVSFDLKSFVVHIGTNPRGGHYVCCRKEGDSWFYFNDNTAYKIHEASAFRMARQASMMFYEKRS